MSGGIHLAKERKGMCRADPLSPSPGHKPLALGGPLGTLKTISFCFALSSLHWRQQALSGFSSAGRPVAQSLRNVDGGF